MVYTYDVYWDTSSITWSSRWDAYLRMPGGKVHWFSILNSLMVVVSALALWGLGGRPGRLLWGATEGDPAGRARAGRSAFAVARPLLTLPHRTAPPQVVMSCIVAMIMMRTIRRDLQRYEQLLVDGGAHGRRERRFAGATRMPLWRQQPAWPQVEPRASRSWRGHHTAVPLAA